MLRTLIASALAAACGVTYAQSVTVYGIVDAAVEHLKGVGSPGGTLDRMPSLTGSVPSRLGFRGNEDLGGGLRALFTLEQGFGPDTGMLNQGGRMFGRQAFVGLSDYWGAVTLGRQYTMLYWSLLDADILGPSIYSSSSLDNYIPNARSDNTVAYKGTFGGLTLGATYSLGRDTVNAGPSPSGTNCPGESATDSKACRAWSALAKYDAQAWGVALAVDEQRGGPGAFGGLTSSALKDTRVSANGYFKLGDAKIAAGVISRDNEGAPAAARSDLWYVGASYSIGPVLIDGEVFQLRYKSNDNKALLGAVRATYFLSKRTALYATTGHINNDGSLAISVSSGAPGSAPAPGTSQTGFATGIRHVF